MSVQFDLVGFTTTTTGTGTTIDVGAAIPDSGLRTLAGAAIPDGTVVSYALVTGTGSGTQRETGTATVASSGTQLTGRTLVSSTTGSLINLVGTSTVMLGPNRADFEAIGPVQVSGTPSVGQVPVATGPNAATWQTPSGGGGLPAGVTSPGDGALDFATGTLTSNRPSLNVAQTWNASGQTFYGIDLRITNTASGSNSRPIRVRSGAAGTTDIAQLTVGGDFRANTFGSISDVYGMVFGSASLNYMKFGGSSYGLVLSNSRTVGWGPAGYWTDANTPTVDAALGRTSAGLVEINSGSGGTLRDLRLRNLTSVGGVITPSQYTTATRPAWTNGAVIFDSDLDKLVIGGAAAWEVVTSA